IDLLGRLCVCAVIDDECDFRGLGGGTILRAGEDHVLHGGTAHAFVRGLAHRPAERLEQVRLAAAVRADHAGQAGLDQELGGLDEGFEAEKAESGDFHVSEALQALDITSRAKWLTRRLRLSLPKAEIQQRRIRSFRTTRIAAAGPARSWI